MYVMVKHFGFKPREVRKMSFSQISFFLRGMEYEAELEKAQTERATRRAKSRGRR